jgi:hypothetical protein
MDAKVFAEKYKVNDNAYSIIPVWIWILDPNQNFSEIGDSLFGTQFLMLCESMRVDVFKYVIFIQSFLPGNPIQLER